MVDKTIAYATQSPSGDWQNTIMFLGDDGNNNIHMKDIDEAANQTIANHPGYYVRKVLWDAYTRVSSSTGHRYPEVTKIIKQQQNDGALIIDYGGHGSEISISHEAVLTLPDLAAFRGKNSSLWVTESCYSMPFDGLKEIIGETMVLIVKGGSVAFYGAKIRTAPEETLRRLGLRKGVEVVSVGPGKLAEAGVSEGFVILYVNNEAVSSPKDIMNIIKKSDRAVYVEGVSKSGKASYFGFAK